MSDTRVAIVTGACQGIGRAIALRLADDGLDVAINDLESQSSKLKEVEDAIVSRGRRAFVFTGDVSDEATVKSMIDSVVQALGGVDVMVANAAICFGKSFIDTTVEDLDRIYAINTRSVFLCYKYAALQMIKQGRAGRIIGASSGAGKEAAPYLGAYSSTKAAVRALTQAGALEWGRYGITVNCYAPGAVITTMTQELGDSLGSAEAVFAEEAKKTACGYVGQPEYIAPLVSYLASKDAHFVTGQWIAANGGRQFE